MIMYIKYKLLEIMQILIYYTFLLNKIYIYIIILIKIG